MPARRELLAALGLCLLGAVLALTASAPIWVRVAVPRVRPLADVTVAVAGRDLAPAVPALGLVGLAAVVGLVATRSRGRALLGAVLAAAGLAVVLVSVRHFAAPSPVAAADLVVSHGPLSGRDPTRPLHPEAEPLWPALAAVGGLLLATAGVVTAVRGRRWPAMSARYDPPTPQAPVPVPAPAPDLSAPVDPASPETPADPAAPASTPADQPRASRAAPQHLWDALDRGDDPTL